MLIILFLDTERDGISAVPERFVETLRVKYSTRRL